MTGKAIESGKGRKDRFAALPNWPRGMSEPLAASYVGLSASQFRLEVGAGRAPRPGRITERRKIWLKEDLDAYLDRVFGRTRSPPPEHAVSLREELESWAG